MCCCSFLGSCVDCHDTLTADHLFEFTSSILMLLCGSMIQDVKESVWRNFGLPGRRKIVHALEVSSFQLDSASSRVSMPVVAQA